MSPVAHKVSGLTTHGLRLTVNFSGAYVMCLFQIGSKVGTGFCLVHPIFQGPAQSLATSRSLESGCRYTHFRVVSYVLTFPLLILRKSCPFIYLAILF